jgi:hypothetical protein
MLSITLELIVAINVLTIAIKSQLQRQKIHHIGVPSVNSTCSWH